jgi:KDO2-lipid IV(A) lauroyltransferase
MALRTFKNYSNFLVDYGRFSSLDRESMFKVIKYINGEENIRKSIKKNKGIILLTGHLGNWELGGMYFGKQNIKINVLTFRDEMANIHDIRTRYRKFHNIDTIAVGESPFSSIEIINALQRNEVVALLVDRYGKTGGMAVKFFGKPAYFPLGPVILAKISGAPIIPAFVVKVDKKSFRVIVEKPIEVPSNIGKEIGPYLQKIVNVFEKVIREYPDQWYNFAPI